MDASQLKLLYTYMGDIESLRYAALASTAIVVFDHLITLGEEVELIWQSSWTLGKILFIINRYYTLFAVAFNNYGLFTSSLSDSFCQTFFQWQGWTGLIACMIAEVILQMRLYALYFLNKKILAFMITFFILASSASATVMAISLSKVTVLSHFPGITFCIPIGIPSYFYAFWIPMLAYESLLCGLALYRGYQTFKSQGKLFRTGRRLVGILIRDSVIYFVFMFATYLTNLLVWVIGRPSIFAIPSSFSVALSCVLANRIILNVRRANRNMDLTLHTTARATPADLSDDDDQPLRFSTTMDSIMSPISADYPLTPTSPQSSAGLWIYPPNFSLPSAMSLSPTLRSRTLNDVEIHSFKNFSPSSQSEFMAI